MLTWEHHSCSDRLQIHRDLDAISYLLHLDKTYKLYAAMVTVSLYALFRVSTCVLDGMRMNSGCIYVCIQSARFRLHEKTLYTHISHIHTLFSFTLIIIFISSFYCFSYWNSIQYVMLQIFCCYGGNKCVQCVGVCGPVRATGSLGDIWGIQGRKFKGDALKAS